MRRRGRTILMGYRTPSQPHSTSGPAEYPNERALVISEVPEEWRKYARDPWRNLFPDLEWTPPSQDE
jgi:hypothetical protein